ATPRDRRWGKQRDWEQAERRRRRPAGPVPRNRKRGAQHMSLMLTLAIVAGAAAVLYGVLQTLSLLRCSPGNARMQEIAAAIQEGAQAYLQKQYTAIAVVGVVILIAGFFLLGVRPAIGFAIGA